MQNEAKIFFRLAPNHWSKEYKAILNVQLVSQVKILNQKPCVLIIQKKPSQAQSQLVRMISEYYQSSIQQAYYISKQISTKNLLSPEAEAETTIYTISEKEVEKIHRQRSKQEYSIFFLKIFKINCLQFAQLVALKFGKR